MKEYVPGAKDCEHCSKKRGSFGCCSTVSNNWVYSCAEGQKEWALDKITAEIEEAQTYDGIYIDRAYVLSIIDKYRTEDDWRNRKQWQAFDRDWWDAIYRRYRV